MEAIRQGKTTLRKIIMNDQAKLNRQETNRYQILKIFYDIAESNGSGIAIINQHKLVSNVVENELMSQDEANSAFNYLINESLLNSLNCNGDTEITHSGIKEIEASIKNPGQSTSHFSTQAIQFVIKELVVGDSFSNIKNSNISNRSEIKDSFNTTIMSEDKKALIKTMEEIQSLIQQFEVSNPTATESEMIAYIDDETSPSFKRRAVAALQSAGETFIDEFVLENKYLKVGKEAIKSWLQPER
jgi:hypothetical protein